MMGPLIILLQQLVGSATLMTANSDWSAPQVKLADAHGSPPDVMVWEAFGRSFCFQRQAWSSHPQERKFVSTSADPNPVPSMSSSSHYDYFKLRVPFQPRQSIRRVDLSISGSKSTERCRGAHDLPIQVVCAVIYPRGKEERPSGETPAHVISHRSSCLEAVPQLPTPTTTPKRMTQIVLNSKKIT